MMKVLIVDDEADVQLLFKQKFRKEIKADLIKFYFVLSAEEALEFLKSPEASSLVLILSDINMPGMNGLQLLKIIKTEYPHLKVFMNTAYGNDGKQEIAMLYGADSYINKPLNFSSLKEKIFQLISNHC
ncbi:MAG: response regulator [Nostoc sp.]|uniref:response regulator n=1 Tax=Nostoc sp. TaxID=1180 RepID=UPI002FFC270F